MSAPVKLHRKPLPSLVPIGDPIEQDSSAKPVGKLLPKYPSGMLRKRLWFPPKLGYRRAIVDNEISVSLKGCKVVADRECVDHHLFTDSGTTLVHTRPEMLIDFIRNDLMEQKFTDIILKSDRAESKTFHIHKLVLAAHSSKLGSIFEEDDCLVLAGIEDDRLLEQVVHALYNGVVILNGKKELKAFEGVLSALQGLGILLNLRPSLLRTSEAGNEESISSVDNEMSTPELTAATLMDKEDKISFDHQDENDEKPNIEEDESEWELCSFSKPGPRRSKRVPIPRRFSSGSEHEEELPQTKPVELDESQPLTLNRPSKNFPNRKHKMSEDVDVEKVEIKQKKAKKAEADKKLNKSEEPVKTSPRLRQKISTKTPPSAAAAELKKSEESVSKSKNSPKGKKSSDKSDNPPSKLESTRPQRKSVSKMSPEKKRLQIEEEAKSPKFDLASEEVLNDKLKEGQVQFVYWLIACGFLRSKPFVCCNVETTLTSDSDNIDGVSWTCKSCQRRTSVRTGSIFGKSADESLSWIMRLILCWSDNVRYFQLYFTFLF